MTDSERKERAYAAAALLSNQAWQDAIRAVSDQMTNIVMHPASSKEERELALAEFHAITRLNSYVDRWADDLRSEQEHG